MNSSAHCSLGAVADRPDKSRFIGLSDWKIHHPSRLNLPVAIRSIRSFIPVPYLMSLNSFSCFVPFSCNHKFTALDVNNNIWSLYSWGKPYRIVSALLNGFSPRTTPIQVASGDEESYALMESGDVLLWAPYDDQSQNLIRQTMQKLGIIDAEVHRTSDGTIQCLIWDFEQPMYRLPPIPSNLSNLNGTKDETEVKLVKIAGLRSVRIIGLTNKGHVLLFEGHDRRIGAKRGNQNYETEIGGQWIYVRCSHASNCHRCNLYLVLRLHWQLEHFSDPNVITKDRADSSLHGYQSQALTSLVIPRNLQITHVRAICTSVCPNMNE